MKTFIRSILLSSLLLYSISLSGQNTDSIIDKISQYIQTLHDFSQYIPQEKVYLHFDNTSYYQGDNIWFKANVVASDLHRDKVLSKTLYVELLNPGGEIIDKRILKLENGQCHGEFGLKRLPFYSGFYEVRAYTKYMLNFGKDIIFSRLLPVFDKPKEEGHFEEKNMQKYGYNKYPMKREKPLKGKKVNLKFFPEGGNLIQGVPSQVAFEATDAFGNPVELSGVVINEAKKEVAQLSVHHNGRGVFTYTPTDNKSKATVECNGKKYSFDMPDALPKGVVLKVDNLSYTDSVEVALQKSAHLSDETFGVAVISGGKLSHYYLINIEDEDTVRFKFDKSKLTSGVSWIVIFDGNGKIVCDRLIFTNKHEQLNILAKTQKESYNPYEPVEMEFTIHDREENPIQTAFSVSVKDGVNEVLPTQNMLTNLLLMSEIKGYVHNPSYYFEADDSIHRTALDQLLMVQGWRRYSWEKMSGVTPFDLKYKPEQGIETEGSVVSFVRKLPKPNVQVSFFLTKKEEEESAGSFVNLFVTDSLGRFSFVSNVEGKWNMILAVTDKGKKKDYRILLDRVFSPDPKRYQFTELQITTDAEEAKSIETEKTETSEKEDLEAFYKAFNDSLAKTGNHEKTYHLKEVKVTAKKLRDEKDIFQNRSGSIAYYDVQSEMDDIIDKGTYVGNDIHELLINMNNKFSRMQFDQEEFLQYKGKLPLIIINYEPEPYHRTKWDYSRYKMVNVSAIKSIYINENLSTICKYADPSIPPIYIDDVYRCVVFIETFPEGKVPVEPAKGVRKTWLEGYSQVKEFYSPDYSVLPQEPDYRRTLYWNPSVTTDSNGKARILFYNNSRCRKFKISAETITDDGKIGVLTE